MRVHLRELERILIVVGCRDGKPCVCRACRDEARPAPQLEQRPAFAVHAEYLCAQHLGRWPEIGPVRKSLIALELLLVDELFRVRGMEQHDPNTADVDRRLVDAKAPAKCALEVLDVFGIRTSHARRLTASAARPCAYTRQRTESPSRERRRRSP